ncbi:putative ANTH domain-containing protein [Lupinus albus]|uniref:Putative ANTH domain-containing protein n=1 Tax=Lupinus albus TaxID=3870 RepID=A0A6A4PHZ9_LUPAL|nr:putative ANTH domain-containing protein [Lupinus albus]
MGTIKSWRKAYGAIKDTTKVGLAHVNSDYADLDVAIVKATNHVECPPKERHLRKVLFATSAVRPRADVAYCLHALSRRLTKTRNWTVALKTLIVIHRLLREGDPTCREELLNFSRKGHILQVSNFKDDSSPIAWDCSAWVRTYALFLEERLECFRILQYDIEAERLNKPAEGQEKGYSKTRDLNSEKLMEQLPALQQLLYRLVGCRPEGAAVSNNVLQYALALVCRDFCLSKESSFGQFYQHPKKPLLTPIRTIYTDGWCIHLGVSSDFWVYIESPSLHMELVIQNLYIDWSEIVLKESFKIYCAINDGIINLVDKFFEMPKHEAIKALNAYKRAGQQAESLSDFYEVCKGLQLARNFQFPVLREPPQSFLTTMEEYIMEAPRVVTVSSMPLLLTYTPEEALEIKDTKLSEEEQEPSVLVDNNNVVSNSEPAPPPPPPPYNFEIGDLLGLNDTAPNEPSIEERNAFALAIVPTETGATSAFNPTQPKDFDPTGWELALVTAPSTNISSVNERQLAGGLDTLTLNSLYDEAVYRSTQQPVYGAPAAPNPFEVQDPFALSTSVLPPPDVQIASLGQQQQVNPFGPVQPFEQPQQQQQDMPMNPANPFLDAIGYEPFPAKHVSHPQNNNPFGTPGLL